MSEQVANGQVETQAKWPQALNEIKDTAVMMKMAGQYVCQDRVVTRIGERMADSVDSLERQLEEIKKLFVGKPLQDIDLSEPVEELRKLASTLREPDPETLEKCKSGELGHRIAQKTAQLAELTQELINKIEGKDLEYKKSEVILTGFKRLRFLVHTFVTTYKILTKVILATALSAVIALGLLFATMETEKDIMAVITQSRADIRAAQAALSRVEEQIAKLKAEMEELDSPTLEREKKIKILEMSVRAHHLKEKREKLLFEVAQKEKLLEENIKKMEELKNKSFLARLLRF